MPKAAYIDAPGFLQEAERAWLAALIDGEGSVMMNKRTFSDERKAKSSHASVYTMVRYRPTVCVAATTQYVLMDAIAKRVAGSIYEHRVSNALDSYNPRARRQWTFRWNVEQAMVYLPQVLPWLVIKHDQAVLLIEAMEIKRRLNPSIAGSVYNKPERVPLQERLDEIYAAIRAANTRGRTPGERGREMKLLEEAAQVV